MHLMEGQLHMGKMVLKSWQYTTTQCLKMGCISLFMQQACTCNHSVVNGNCIFFFRQSLQFTVCWMQSYLVT